MPIGLIAGFIEPTAADSRILLYTRLTVVSLGIIGFFAGNLFPTILSMALWAYTMYGAAITPALLAIFLWPRVTRAGGVASITVMTSTPVEEEVTRYDVYLRQVCGVAEATRIHRTRHVREFLASLFRRGPVFAVVFSPDGTRMYFGAQRSFGVVNENLPAGVDVEIKL